MTIVLAIARMVMLSDPRNGVGYAQRQRYLQVLPTTMTSLEVFTNFLAHRTPLIWMDYI